MVKSILIVGSGGFFGTVFRYLLSRYILHHLDSVFPWSTFTVNIIGSLIIGIIYGIVEKGQILGPNTLLFFTVGICGGFTTFSSLSNDAFLLLEERDILNFFLYTSLSIILGLLSVYIGRFLIQLI